MVFIIRIFAAFTECILVQEKTKMMTEIQSQLLIAGRGPAAVERGPKIRQSYKFRNVNDSCNVRKVDPTGRRKGN